MGTGATRQTRQEQGEKLVYQKPKTGATFIHNEDKTALQFQCEKTPWQRNCIYIEQPVNLSDGLTLKFTGTGIVRYGFATENPEAIKDLGKATIVGHEDGFEYEENVRSFLVDAFSFLIYKDDRGKEKQLSEIDEGTKTWFYIIVIHGRPTVCIENTGKSSEPLKLKTFQSSNISIKGNAAVPGRTSNSGLCRLENAIDVDKTYCINWQMKLPQSSDVHVCESNKYGFFRFGFVTEVLKDLNDISIYSDSIGDRDMWFAQSAISSTQYNETVMFTIDQVSKKIRHNLVLSSAIASESVTEKFPLDCKKPLYLVFEVFHGDICSVQKYPANRAPTLEYPGHILLFRNIRTEAGMPVHIQIGAKLGTEPCRIQYGTNPALVLAEFRMKFRPATIKNLSGPWAYVEEITESEMVQVLDVPNDTEKDDLEMYFSNKSASDGGPIKEISKIEDIRGCWVMKYQHREDARAVWQAGQHRMKNSMVTVLPYYEKLGPTANHGQKPTFDATDLEIIVDDEKKMNFIANVDKTRFEQHMRKLNLHVTWPEIRETEFEDDDESDNEVDEKRFIITCKIPVAQYQKLVTWKDNAKKAVDEYLSKIQTFTKTVDKRVWKDVVQLIAEEKLTKEFVYEVDNSSHSVKLTASNSYLMSELKSKIKSIEPPEDQISEDVEIDPKKYKTLDELGLLTKLEANNPKTSSTLDTKNGKLIFKGPISEVKQMKEEILTLIIKVETVAIKQTKERLEVLKETHVGELLGKELEKRRFTKQFAIRDSVIEVNVFCKSRKEVENAKRVIKECTESILPEDTYIIPDNLVESLHRLEDKEASLREIEERNNNSVKLILSDTKITLIGTTGAIQNAKTDIDQLLKEAAVDKSVAFFQRNIVNYMYIYADSKNYDLQGSTFLENKDGLLTGEVCIEGKPGEIKQRNESLNKVAEKISTFWFYLERPWLANVITNLHTLETLADDHQCLLQPVIGDALAESGVSVVAVSDDGTIIQIINCDMTVQDTDVIVNAANGELEMIGGLAKAISDAAGPSVQEECNSIVQKYGQLKEGNAVFTTAGKLDCREILHVFGPMWRGGDKNEKEILQRSVGNILSMMTEKKYLSVMIPAISCGIFGYPNEKATEHIVEAIYSFVSKNPKSTVKEIYLCDNRQELVSHFETAVKKVLNRQWFIFEHKRQINKMISPDTRRKTKPGEKTVHLRQKLGRPGQGVSALDQSIRWGRNRGNSSHTSRNSISSGGSDGEDSDNAVSHRQNSPMPNGLPMSVDLTGQTKLDIITGTIETQKKDVIVCTTPKFPDIVGAVANALTKKGGSSIEDECKQKGKLNLGEVINTDKGALGCKQLFHVLTLMNWSAESGPKNVKNIVEPCLRKADQMGYKSLAFPAIGMGASHYPPATVAEIMIQTLVKYLENNPTTGINNVTIVIYERDAITAQAFEARVPKLLAPRGISPNKTKHSAKEMLKKKGPKEALNPQTSKVKSLRVKYVEPQKADAHSIADDVVLIQVTTDGTSLEKIKQEAEKLLSTAFLTREINLKSQTNEHRLTEDEKKELAQLNTTKVKVTFNQLATKVIISGLRADVLHTENEACNLLWTDFPQRRKQKKIEALINEFVQWKVSDNKSSDGYKNVSTEVNFELEINFEKGVDFIYSNQGTEFKVLVLSYEEHPVNQPNMKRTLKRQIRAAAGITIPDSWEINKDEDYKAVDIPANDPLFSKIKKKFMDAGCKPNAINKIIRIENRTLYLQYEVLKKKFQIRNPKGIQNERELWHGSDSATIPLICQKGFNRSFAGKHNTLYGEGVYFATSSSYSHGFAPQDGNGTRRMILCLVLTGQYKLGQKGMKAPTDNNDPVVYDTLVDNPNNPSIFVIFHDTQAYPQYVIEYN